jgi:hypothetical protein
VIEPSLELISKLELPHYLNNDNNNDVDESVRIFASMLIGYEPRFCALRLTPTHKFVCLFACLIQSGCSRCHGRISDGERYVGTIAGRIGYRAIYV